MIDIQEFASRFQGAVPTGDNQWEAFCPCHPDGEKHGKRSLSISLGNKGIVVYCHAGCKTHDVVWAVDCKMTDLFRDEPKDKGTRGRIKEVYQYHNADGSLAFEVLRLENPKEFRQRKDAQQQKWSMKGVEKVLYRLPEIIAAETVIVVEGEKDVDNLRACGFIATTNAGGAAAGKSKWLASYNDSLAGKHVVIIPDLDKPDDKGERAGTRHALHVADQLKGKAASVKIVELPIEEKQDVSDWLANGGTAEELRRIIEATPEWGDGSILSPKFAHGPGKSQDDRIKDKAGLRYPVEVHDDEHLTNEAALQGLSRDPGLYCRGGDVVKVATERVGCDLVPRIVRLSNAVIRDRLSAACYFFKTATKEGDDGPEEVERQVRPPQTTVNAIAGRGHFDDVLRPLHGVMTSPFIRPDGEIVTTPGYDEVTGYLYHPIGEQPTVKERPTKDDAVRAVDTLLDVVDDFPFDKPEDASAWLALVLTMVGRATFHGPTPMWLFDANTRGAGKGLLADVAVIIATGRPVSVTPIPEDDAEMRKRITAAAIGGDSVVMLDNADCALGSASLDAVLTSTVWKDRVLGKSEQVELPINAVWIATGNNLQVKGDLSRRVVQCRLVSNQERPEERADFAHRDLREYVRENRPALYAAALTILRSWYVAGRPKHNLKSWGSYEAWSGVVREAMAFVCQHDPILTRDRIMATSDTEAAAIAGILESWPELSRYMNGDPDSWVSCTAKEIIRAIQEQPDRLPTMAAAVENLTGQSGVKLSSRSLGRRFTQFQMRVVGGKRLVGVAAHGGVKSWMVQHIE